MITIKNNTANQIFLAYNTQ